MNPQPAQSIRIDKFARRRAELGQATLQTLASLGYAKTSLREIAQNSEFSHGVLHYYFTDKLDLILCSVRQYKAICVRRYDRAIAQSTSFDDMMKRFLGRLSATVRKDAALHRLWYDVRAQSLFEKAFQNDVAAIDRSLQEMIARVIGRFADLAGTPNTIQPEVAYAMFDGLFQQCLLKHLSGDKHAVPVLLTQVRWLISQFMTR